MAYSPHRRCVADAFTPAIKKIVADFLHLKPDDLKESDFITDVSEATDLIAPDRRHIAIRIRASEFKEKYYGEFTIRTSTDFNGVSELDKIVAGKVDLIFYGFACADGQNIDSWWLLDPHAIIAAVRDDFSCMLQPYEIECDDAKFLSFRIAGFPQYPQLVLASNQPSLGFYTCSGCSQFDNRRLVEEWNSVATGVYSDS